MRTWSRPLDTRAVQTTRMTRGQGLVVDSVRARVCDSFDVQNARQASLHSIWMRQATFA